MVLKILAIVMATLSLATSVSMFTLSAVNGKGIYPIEDSLILGGIQWFIVLQEAAIFLYTQRLYVKIILDDGSNPS